MLKIKKRKIKKLEKLGFVYDSGSVKGPVYNKGNIQIMRISREILMWGNQVQFVEPRDMDLLFDLIKLGFVEKVE